MQIHTTNAVKTGDIVDNQILEFVNWALPSHWWWKCGFQHPFINHFRLTIWCMAECNRNLRTFCRGWSVDYVCFTAQLCMAINGSDSPRSCEISHRCVGGIRIQSLRHLFFCSRVEIPVSRNAMRFDGLLLRRYLSEFEILDISINAPQEN